jgi:DNA-binding transcriptional MerR regulator
MTTGTRHGPLTVSQLAARAALRPDTIRYYERIGLLPPASRTVGDHRRYDEAALDRLLFIRGAQRLGLHLAEVADLLAVRDTGTCPCDPAETLLRRRLTDIDAEIIRLTTLRGEITTMLERIPGPGCAAPEPGTWCPPSDNERRREPMSCPRGNAHCDGSCCGCDCDCC